MKSEWQQVYTARPSRIREAHWQEWLESGVDPGIIARNLESLSQFEVDDYSHEANFPIAELLNWKVIRFGHSVKPQAPVRGWAVTGVDPRSFGRMDWGRFKPDPETPVQDKTGRLAKYLSPSRGPNSSRLILLDVPRHIWQRVSDRAAIPVGIYTEFWRWVIEQHVPVVLCEGEKKAGCLLSHGYAAIALPGIHNGIHRKDNQGNPLRQPRLLPDLEPFATEARKIFICFDYETKASTVKAIEAETRLLSQVLRRTKAVPLVIHLPGPQKGVDDFIVAGGDFERVYAAALPYDRWEVAKYSKLTYPVAAHVKQRYLDVDIPRDAKIVALKSPKGTGKTQSFIKLVAEAVEVGRRVLLIGHRVQLVQAIADRVGIPYVTELRSAEEGSLLGYGLCIDSLHEESQARFHAAGWDDALVIIDESEQVIWHLLDADTEIRQRRIQVLQELRNLLICVLESPQGQVILSDADLSNLSIDFIRRTAEMGNCPVWIAVNHWQPEDESWDVRSYDKSEAWFTTLLNEVRSGGKPFVVTHSQAESSKWGTCTIEGVLREQFPDRRWLRIDSDTIADPTHPAYGCIANLNAIVGDYDGIIASPSIETGVSVDVRGHFTAMFGWAGGGLPETSARQSFARLREPVPRHLFLGKHGLGKIGTGAITRGGLLMSQRQMAAANIQQLRNAFVDLEAETIQTNEVALDIWAKMACRINAGMIAYRETVLTGLRAEGHRVREVLEPDPDPKGTGKMVAEVRDRQYEAHIQEICEAEVVTESKAEELQKKKSKTPSERSQLRRFVVEKRYGTTITPELVRKEDEGWYGQLKNDYYYGVGKGHLAFRELQTYQAGVANGLAWLPTLNRSQLGLRIWLFDQLRLKDLMHPDAAYHADHPAVRYTVTLAQAHSYAIKTALGITISSDEAETSPLRICQKLLALLGHKISYEGRVGTRGDRRRVYRFIPPTDGREAVYEKWLYRDATSRNESAVSSRSGLDSTIGGAA